MATIGVVMFGVILFTATTVLLVTVDISPTSESFDSKCSEIVLHSKLYSIVPLNVFWNTPLSVKCLTGPDARVTCTKTNSRGYTFTNLINCTQPVIFTTGDTSTTAADDGSGDPTTAPNDEATVALLIRRVDIDGSGATTRTTMVTGTNDDFATADSIHTKPTTATTTNDIVSHFSTS